MRKTTFNTVETITSSEILNKLEETKRELKHLKDSVCILREKEQEKALKQFEIGKWYTCVGRKDYHRLYFKFDDKCYISNGEFWVKTFFVLTSIFGIELDNWTSIHWERLLNKKNFEEVSEEKIKSIIADKTSKMKEYFKPYFDMK